MKLCARFSPCLSNRSTSSRSSPISQAKPFILIPQCEALWRLSKYRDRALDIDWRYKIGRDSFDLCDAPYGVRHREARSTLSKDAFRFSASYQGRIVSDSRNLLSRHSGGEFLLGDMQRQLGCQTGKQIERSGNDSRPSGLMAGP